MNIVDSPKLHKAIWKRWEELDLTQADIIHDAEERGLVISPPRLSAYKNMLKNKNKKGTITSDQLLWLCVRYGLEISFNIGKATPPTKFVIQPYDELSCLKRLKQVFPNTKMSINDIK